MSRKHPEYDDLNNKTRKALEGMGRKREYDSIQARILGITLEQYLKLSPEEKSKLEEDQQNNMNDFSNRLKETQSLFDSIMGKSYYEDIYLPKIDTEYSKEKQIEKIISKAQYNVEEEFKILFTKIELRNNDIKYIDSELDRIADSIIEKYGADDYNSIGIEWFKNNRKFPSIDILNKWYSKGESFREFIELLLLHEQISDYKSEIQNTDSALNKKVDKIIRTKISKLRKDKGGFVEQDFFSLTLFNLFTQGIGDNDILFIDRVFYSLDDFKEFLFSNGKIKFHEGITWGDIYTVASILKYRYFTSLYYKDFGSKCGIKNLSKLEKRLKKNPKHLDEIETVFNELEQKLLNK